MGAGIEMAEWFANEAQRVFLMLGETADDRARRDLAEKIEGKGGRITARQLMRTNNRKYPTSEDAEEALNELVSCRYGEWSTEGKERVFILTRSSVETVPHDTAETNPT